MKKTKLTKKQKLVLIEKSKKRRTTSFRCPVIYKGKPLMPMKWSRVKKYVKSNKGVLVCDRRGIWYLKLKIQPSATNTQNMALGIDPGTAFTGCSVVSEMVHNFNLQHIHCKKKRIIANTALRRSERRRRRLRLRHRKSRFSFRTGNIITKTSHYIYQSRIQLVKDILKLYPISAIVHEEVRFNYHQTKNSKTKTKSLSAVDIGNHKFRKYLDSLKNVYVFSERGYNTAKYRKMIFGHDLKHKTNKGVKSFYAHCIDSFALASTCFEKISQNIKQPLNTVCVWNQELLMNSNSTRRTLRKFTNKSKFCDIPFFRYDASGKIYVFKKYHKAKRVRQKLSSSQKSNHGPWTYATYIKHKHISFDKRKYMKLHGSYSWRGKKLKNTAFDDCTGYYNAFLLSYCI